MAIYEVFSRPVLIRYKTSICSSATFFYAVTILIKFILPFILTYYSQGFWKKIDFYQEQPDISFKHKMIFILETRSPDQLAFWSTYENINAAMKQDFLQILPEIEHREEDLNRDGTKDKLEMSITVPLEKQEVVSLKILLIFDYNLHLHSDFKMECAAYVHHNAFLPGAEFNVIGDIVLYQREPLKHTGKDERFNVPVVRESMDEPPTNLEDILMEYAKRNITTAFLNSYPVWKTGRMENKPFKINIVIKYPSETVLYKVGFWQVLKWGLVQYMSVFLIVSFAIHVLRRNVFRKQLLSTLVILPTKQKV